MTPTETPYKPTIIYIIKKVLPVGVFQCFKTKDKKGHVIYVPRINKSTNAHAFVQ